MNIDEATGSYLNMVLSLRGAERQPPNLLQMSLRFSSILKLRADQGVHAKELTPEQRLRKVVAEFQDTPGFLNKWSLDDDKVMSLLNIIQGTSEETRELINGHLHAHKWAQCAFNVELMRRPRWLLGACLRGVPDCFRKVLTVKSLSQGMFIRLVVSQFVARCRKVRPSQRAKVRLNPQEWDNFVNYACVFSAALEEAKTLNNAKPGWEQELAKAFDAM